MKAVLTPCMLIAIQLASLAEVHAALPDGVVRIEVERFIDLPGDVRHPEGLAVDPVRREIYVGTFDARTPEKVRNNQLLRFSAEGKLLARRSFGATPLTGIEVDRGKVYILNFGASQARMHSSRIETVQPGASG